VARGALVNAGAEVRTLGLYAFHHVKVTIADRQTVEQGGFNCSDAAAHRNSENVLVTGAIQAGRCLLEAL